MLTLPPDPSSINLGDDGKKKIKVLTLSDHPVAPSGVGIQTNNMCKALLDSGNFQILSLGGAIKHQDYRPIQFEPYNENWIIHPVDGYGEPNMVRSALRSFRPDIVWFMTDPRFWGWLWDMENEIRRHAPMVYYHVWDNYPYPKYNKRFYESNDHIVTISKLTDDIVKTVAPSVPSTYLPHAVDQKVFKNLNLTTDQKRKFKSDHKFEDGMLFFWNSRNARRKQSGSLLYWFKDFLDEVGHDKATLLMHTNPKDPNGQDLNVIVEELGLDAGQVWFSQEAIGPELLATLYNVADCTICISDAEGFGLSTLESLACGTPIITTMTGGPQEQVTDGTSWFGIGLEPVSKAIIGSQEVPYIYEDRLSGDDVRDALLRMYNMTSAEREELGELGTQHVTDNYSFDSFNKRWVDLMLNIHEECGSWENRKNHQPWHFMEVL
jgi:glycosyltransferase involved in cell wall biosynthesis